MAFKRGVDAQGDLVQRSLICILTLSKDEPSGAKMLSYHAQPSLLLSGKRRLSGGRLRFKGPWWEK